MQKRHMMYGLGNARGLFLSHHACNLAAMKQDLTTLSGDRISSYCFGTMQFGGTADKIASQGMFDACVAAGINFFDTAYVYTDGRSEQLLGELIAGKSD
ncbi:MAG: aldo/keto reductase, partial [Paracoccaceae bacterium]